MKPRALLLALLMCAILQSIVILSQTPARGMTAYYVSLDGNNSWSGALPAPNADGTDGPFATLERARDAIRGQRSGGELPAPVSVYVRGGTYRLKNTFLLDYRDSGSEASPVLYAAYPGEEVIIAGSAVLKTNWKAHNGHIFVADLPEYAGERDPFCQLFANGRRQVRARIPNLDEKCFEIAGAVENKDLYKHAFRYHDGDIKKWTNLRDAVVINYHSWDEAILRIMDLDLERNIVYFTGPTGWAFDYARDGLWGIQRYYVENVFEGLDSPGEWYFDRHAGKLYFIPPAGINLEDAVISVPVVREAIHLQGDPENNHPIEYVSFHGFTITETDWRLPAEGYPGGQADVGAWQSEKDMSAGIVMEGTTHSSIRNCTIKNIGYYGVTFGKGCQYDSLVSNEITAIGAGGVKIGTTDRSDYTTKRNFVHNNHIHDCGIIYNGGVGVWIGQSAENLVSHNEIHDINYSGMSVGWTWNLDDNPCYGNIIEFNDVYHVVKNANDGAGIYMLGKQAGSIIRNNLFHDIKPHHHLAWGIYLDGHCSNVTVMDNIAYRCEWGNSMTNPGTYNFWINNIFVDAGRGQLYWGTEDRSAYNRFIQNIVYYSGENAYLIDESGRPEIRKKMIEMDYNLYYYTRGSGPEDMKIRRWNQSEADISKMEIQSFYDWQRLGFDFHSIIADPLFMDYLNDDFRLRPESPAFKLGFKQIDVSMVGRLND